MAIGINFEQDDEDVGVFSHLKEYYDPFYNPALEKEIALLKQEIKKLKKIIRENSTQQKAKQKK